MSGPWEDYQAKPAEEGPWADYAPAKPKPKPAANSDIANLMRGKKPQNAFERFREDQRKKVGVSPGAAVVSTALDAGDAFVHHLTNLPTSLGQLTGEALAAGSRLLPEGNPVRNAAEGMAADNRQRVNQWEAGYQARTPDTPGAYGGAVIGETLPWMTGLGELRAAGILPQVTGNGLGALARKGGVLAVEGGLMGLGQPVVGDGSYGTEKAKQVAVGAAAAPVIATGAAGVGVVAGGVRAAARYATPAGREAIANARVAKIYGDSPEAVARLREPSGVPGFELTPSQALGTPEAVQAERVLRNNGQTAPAFAARESQNNAAARNTVAGVAKDDAAMEAAKAARRAIDQPFRQKYLPEEGSPLVDASNVTNLLKKLSLSGNDTVRQAAKKHLALLEEHAAQNGGKIPAYALDDIRQGVGSTLRSIPQHGAVTPKETVIYGGVSSAITDALERAIPGYRNHLAAYARASQPINDMEAGRALLAAIDSGGRDAGGNQAVSLNQVKALLSKDNRADFPMSESARKQIEAVLEALQKRSIAHNNIAATGPGTAADVQRAIQNSPLLMRLLGHGAAGVGGVFGGVPGFLAGAGAVEGANALNNAVARKVGEKAASAPLTADAIEAYLRQQKQQPPNGLMRLMLPYTQPPKP
jgi:hypothetical protein